jgi:hypothetical protein
VCGPLAMNLNQLVNKLVKLIAIFEDQESLPSARFAVSEQDDRFMGIVVWNCSRYENHRSALALLL